MSFQVTITLTTVGSLVGDPITLTANVGNVTPNTLTISQLLAGYTVTLDDDKATTITLTPSGDCPPVIFNILGLPTPTPTITPTPSSTSTPTSTISSTPTSTITDTPGVTPTPTTTPTPSETLTPTPSETLTVTPSETLTPTPTETLTCDDCFSYTIQVLPGGGGGDYSYIDCDGVTHNEYVGYEGTANITCAVENSVLRDVVLQANSTLTQGSLCGNTCVTPTPTTTITPTPTITETISPYCVDFTVEYLTQVPSECGDPGENYDSISTITVTLYDSPGGTPINATENITVTIQGVRTGDCPGYPFDNFVNVPISIGSSSGFITGVTSGFYTAECDSTCDGYTISYDFISETSPTTYLQCPDPTPTPTLTPTPTPSQAYCSEITIYQADLDDADDNAVYIPVVTYLGSSTTLTFTSAGTFTTNCLLSISNAYIIYSGSPTFPINGSGGILTSTPCSDNSNCSGS